MINWETIKSLYNDKPTLLEWLKKVEAALTGATLTSVSVNTISVDVITLTFEFDDGTSITTPNINLPQGAQGVSVTGASIVAGKLILTLSNGTTINAGNTGAVLGFEIDSNQHLIVKYQDGTSEDLGAIFAGNVSISGNLSVVGTITNALLNNTEKVLSGSEDVSNYYANEGDITFGANAVIDDYFDIDYAHWRVSNGKLSVVVNISTKYDAANPITIPAMTNETKSFVLPLPSWIKDKLFTIPPTDRLCVDQKEMQWNFTGTSPVITPKPKIMMFKSGVNVTIALYISNTAPQTIGATTMYMARFEENFIL